MKAQEKNKLKPAGIVMIIIGVVTIIVLILFILFGHKFLLKSNVEFEPDQTTGSHAAVSDSISIPGFEAINIQAGSKKVSSPFYNPDKNTCYFEISVVLDDGGEEIYKSKYLAPGQKLYEIELTRSLPKGSYKATIHYNTYSIEDFTPLNGANVPVTITAK